MKYIFMSLTAKLDAHAYAEPYQNTEKKLMVAIWLQKL